MCWLYLILSSTSIILRKIYLYHNSVWIFHESFLFIFLIAFCLFSLHKWVDEKVKKNCAHVTVETSNSARFLVFDDFTIYFFPLHPFCRRITIFWFCKSLAKATLIMITITIPAGFISRQKTIFSKCLAVKRNFLNMFMNQTKCENDVLVVDTCVHIGWYFRRELHMVWAKVSKFC